MAKQLHAQFNPIAFLSETSQGVTISNYLKEKSIFFQGDAANSIFYIQKGKVKLTVTSQLGKEAVVGIFGPTQFFGEAILSGHPLRMATTVALEECLITSISKSTMIAMLNNQAEFSKFFLEYLLSRNSRIEEDLIDQLFNSSEKRLARVLLLLANYGAETPPHPIQGNINQTMLAEMIGTTRPRVNFFLNKFRKLGFISYNGKIEVHNALLSAVLQDNPGIDQDKETKRADP